MMHKYETVRHEFNIPIGLINQLPKIESVFKAGETNSVKVFNALLMAMTMDIEQLSKNDDNLYLVVPFEERNDNRLLELTLPVEIYNYVQEKYNKHSETGKLDENSFIKRLLSNVLNNGKYSPNLDNIKPVFSFVGQKNADMRKKTNTILESILQKENMTYLEPFCGSASLFLSLPIRKDWKCILNDLDKNKVNLLRVIRDYPYELISKVLERKYDPNDYIIEKTEFINAEGKKETKAQKGSNPKRNELVSRIKIMDKRVEWYENAEWFVDETTDQNTSESNEALFLEHADNKRSKQNCYIDCAVDFLIYSAMIPRVKLDIKKFNANLDRIPLVSLKLNKTKAKILNGDGVKLIKKYKNDPQTIHVIDTPYIKSEGMCDVDDFSKRHSETAKQVKGIKGYFLYFCRSSCPLGYGAEKALKDETDEEELMRIERNKSERLKGDIIIKGIIDDLYRDKNFFYEEYLLKQEDTSNAEIKEFMITNFEHQNSSPYK